MGRHHRPGIIGRDKASRDANSPRPQRRPYGMAARASLVCAARSRRLPVASERLAPPGAPPSSASPLARRLGVWRRAPGPSDASTTSGYDGDAMWPADHPTELASDCLRLCRTRCRRAPARLHALTPAPCTLRLPRRERTWRERMRTPRAPAWRDESEAQGTLREVPAATATPPRRSPPAPQFRVAPTVPARRCGRSRGAPRGPGRHQRLRGASECSCRDCDCHADPPGMQYAGTRPLRTTVCVPHGLQWAQARTAALEEVAAHTAALCSGRVCVARMAVVLATAWPHQVAHTTASQVRHACPSPARGGGAF